MCRQGNGKVGPQVQRILFLLFTGDLHHTIPTFELHTQTVRATRTKSINCSRFLAAQRKILKAGTFSMSRCEYQVRFLAISSLLPRQSLSEGQKDVAAVLACAALEDAIKRLAQSGGIAADGKTMAELVNALKSAGLVAGAQKTLLDAMPRIRNMALHAEWEKITEQDVGSVLGYVEQLLLSKFSGG